MLSTNRYVQFGHVQLIFLSIVGTNVIISVLWDHVLAPTGFWDTSRSIKLGNLDMKRGLNPTHLCKVFVAIGLSESFKGVIMIKNDYTKLKGPTCTTKMVNSKVLVAQRLEAPLEASGSHDHRGTRGGRADPNAGDVEGISPLHLAAQRASKFTIRCSGGTMVVPGLGVEDMEFLNEFLRIFLRIFFSSKRITTWAWFGI